MFVISGPSGTGKGAICAGLLEREIAVLSISMTTRLPREHEVDGKSYYFVKKAEFEEAIAKDELFEYAEIYGEYYGTPKAPVMKHLEAGTDVILEIDVNGARQVKERKPDAVLIFIIPPSPEELKRRIENRGTETPERIAKRLERSESEISHIMEYDYCVVNDKLPKAIDDVFAIMRTEKLLRERNLNFLGLWDKVRIRRALKMSVLECAERIINGYKAGRAI